MANSLGSSGRSGAARALAHVTILALIAACGSDRPSGPDTSGGATDSLLHPDTVTTPQDTVVDPPPSDPLLPPTDTVPFAPTYSGIPFGPHNLWYTSFSRPAWGPEPFTMSSNADAPDSLIVRINAARRLGHRLILMMTSGRRTRYVTNGKFDLAKWKARQIRYDTPAIKAAMAAAVADGTVIVADVIDEPNNKGWGGVVTKPMLDEMAAFVKRIFPTLPVGVSIRWDWRPDERYHVVDFIVTQFAFRFGSITQWRDQALEAAKQNGISVVFSFNAINGGTPISGCPVGRTGGKGTYSCRMTPDQIREAGEALGPAGCALLMYQFNDQLVASPENRQALKDVAAKLAKMKPRPCRRH
jgi:hypothetical protein